MFVQYSVYGFRFCKIFFLQGTLQTKVPYVIMYLSVHDSDRKRAFTLAGKHSLKGRNYASSIKKRCYGHAGASITNTK